MQAPGNITVKLDIDTTEAEAKLAALRKEAEALRMGLTVKVVCPVCMAGIEYDHKESFAWGSVSLTDFATVEVTAHDGGKCRDHMVTHLEDGSWAGALRKRAEELAALAERAEQFRK
jgi:hypothetical protein